MSVRVDARFSELLAQLYRGIHAPRPWEQFLEALAQWLDATFATLIIAAQGMAQPGTFLTPGADPRLAAEYVERLFADDPFRSLPDGMVTSFAEFIAAHSPGAFAEYRAYLAQTGGEQVLAVDLRFPRRFEARFRVTRTAAQPDFSAEDRARFQYLVPHLRNAVALFEKLQFAQAEHRVLRAATEGLGLAFLVIDRDARLLSSNSLADRILAEREGIYASGSELRFDAPALRRRLNTVLDPRSTAAGIARFRIARPDHGDVIATARAIELPAIYSGTAALALFLSRRGIDPAIDPAAIRDLLGVTPAEARLCAALARGESLVTAARDLNIARNTAKAQLRSIFAKTQVHRQSQLVSLLAGLTG